MHPILQRIINNKLQDFAGSRVMGTVELTDELVNEVIKLTLKSVTSPTATTQDGEVATDAVTNVESMPSITELLQAIELNKLDYRTEKGKMVVEIDARVPG